MIPRSEQRPPGVFPHGAAGVGVAALLVSRSAHAAEGGLRIFPDLPMLLFLIVLFLVLVAPLQALLFRPLLRVLDERMERIAGARERAQRIGQEAEELSQRHARTLRDVREQAEGARRERVDAAKQENNATVRSARASAEAEIERARNDVRSAVEEARSSLRAEADALGRLVAERLLGRSLS